MNYRLKAPEEGQSIALPLDIVDKLGEVGEDELKFILAAYAYDASGKDGEDRLLYICEKCAMTKEQCAEYAAFWRGAGYLKTGFGKSKEKTQSTEKRKALFDTEKKPSYSSADIARAAENSLFCDLCEYAQNRLGKAFNTSELATLYSFLDYLKMPVGVVMLVIEHCASKGKGSLRYVEKMLISMADAGVDDYPKADAYLQEIQKKQSFENQIRTLLGLGPRALTAKEKTALHAWLHEFHSPMPLISLAYEKTIHAIKQPSIPYMHTILEGWFREGITDPAALEQKSIPAIDTTRSYDPAAFFEAAVKRGERKDD